MYVGMMIKNIKVSKKLIHRGVSFERCLFISNTIFHPIMTKIKIAKVHIKLPQIVEHSVFYLFLNGLSKNENAL